MPDESTAAAAVSVEQLEWIDLQNKLLVSPVTGKPYQEAFADKLKRKIRSNPLVPIGCLATSLCLIVGIGSFLTRRTSLSQKMMRARVLAQGFTVVAMVTGVVYSVAVPTKGHSN